MAATSVTLDLKAGETYYLRGDVFPGPLIGTPFLLRVSDAIGAEEIQKCDELPPASPGLDTP